VEMHALLILILLLFLLVPLIFSGYKHGWWKSETKYSMWATNRKCSQRKLSIVFWFMDLSQDGIKLDVIELLCLTSG
jgi:hypothetical protein